MATKRTTKKNAAQTWPQPNPALKDLAVLAGEWKMELANTDFLSNPSATVQGNAYIEWVEGGAFLGLRQELHQGAERPAAPGSIWLIGRDESSGKYEVLYFDARGVSRIYQMSLDGSLWKIWRDSPGFSQRYEGKVSEDGNTINAYWETSRDGVNWEHDFDMTYTKIR